MHTIELMGGVGNQLFQYFAFKSIVENPIFDFSLIGRGPYSHEGSSVRPLVSDSAIDRRKSLGTVRWSAEDKLLKVAHKALRREKVGYSFRPLGLQYSPIVTETISTSNFALRVRGYFQSLEYLGFKPQGENCKRLELSVDTSSIDKGYFREDWSSIHLRLGDFVQLGRNIPGEYYSAALEYLASRGSPENLVVFSDEPELAYSILKKMKVINQFKISLAPKRLSPLDTIWLLSHAKSQIISNSTFSWWGAATNPDLDTAVAPKEWFGRSDVDNSFIPDHWRTIEVDE